MDERITVRFRPEQLDDVIEALFAYADDCVNDREILLKMPRVDRETVNDLAKRETQLLKLGKWLQHVKEEAE